MSERPFMQLYVADYVGDTMHLSTEQHGAYLLLLMTMWRAGGRLPNDESKLARIVGLSPARWRKIAPDVMAFFVIDGNEITQKRLAAEIEKAKEKSQKRAHAGSLGGKAKALKDNEPALANATDLSWHLPETRDQRSESKEEKKEPTCAVAKATRTGIDKAFEEFWSEYPKRGTAANPRKPAREKFERLVKSGADPSEIVRGARLYREAEAGRGTLGSDKIAMASTWLNQERWRDYVAAVQPTPEKSQPPPGRPSREELMRIYGGDGGERTDPGRDREAARRPGESVLRNGEDGGNGPMLRVGPERPRVGPMQGVGSILQRSLGLDAGRDEGLPEQSVPDHDDANGMAPMVRREFH